MKNIAGVKEATGSVDQAIDVIRLCGDRLAVYSGEDSLIFSLMALGGKGVISTVANVAPKETAPARLGLPRGRLAKGPGAPVQADAADSQRVPRNQSDSRQNRAIAHGQVLRRPAPAADADGGGKSEKARLKRCASSACCKTRWRLVLSSAASAGAWAAPSCAR